ncbi:oxidation resistance protein 1 isoform X6 [Diabrotica virgifera virgifera]|uniref:Oxidation resistance protein 1 n=1 Tax=Diabrotica virgifera virgifera TaxID=50390 RepID=A0ABM5KYV4_DIAVI|nr:oxidation resistance protein 1 isoform X6 [Diabrotica virgifera virgifera]
MMSQEVLQVVHEKDPWVEETTISLREHDNSWPNIDEDVPSILDKKGRRKSWHAIKFERKRRKGVIDGSPDGSPVEIRQKRPSWWNIFTNQPWPRSRRASQDVGRVTHKEGFPGMRSKSRSVDHGITSPFDLDALRAKVDSQFDRSLDRDLDGSTNSLSEKRKAGPPENTTVYTVADRDTLTSVAARFDTTPSELTKLNRLATPYIFPGQQLYVPNREQAENDSEGSTPVEDSHDDLPPAEKELLENLRPVSPKPGHVERVRTPSCPQGGSSSEYEDSESAVFRERFLKINVRHITDGQGVVSGVLLVTPNAVMFDPNVIDPLVIEHGPEAYGVIAPMEFVVNAAIYNDIAHMRVGHCESNLSEKQEIYYPKSEKEEEQDSLMVKDETFPELVTGDDAESVCSCTEREGDAFPKAFERELVTPTNLEDPEGQHKSLEERRKSLLDHHWAIPSRDRQSIDTDEMPAITPTGAPDDHIQDEDDSLNKESCHDSGIDIRESSIPPIVHVPPKKKYSDADIVLSKDWVPPITIGATNLSYTSEPTDSPARKKTNSVSFSLDSSSELDPGQPPLSTSYSESKEDVDKADSRKNKMLKRLSYPLSWVETTLSGDKDEDKPPSQPHSAADVQHSSVFSKVFSRRSSVGTFMRQPTESSSKSKTPAPKLDYRSMVSVEDMPELFVSFDKLIPRPARSCDDPPLYLRLRMGKPLNKVIPRSTPLMSYGKKKMRPEYWFSVPKNRIDELYKFIQGWVPHLYGELDEEKVKERGFSLVEMDTELWSEEPTPSASRHGSQDGEITELTKESWEVLPMSEELRRAFYSSSAAPSLDIELTPPDLIGTTEILKDHHREHLCRHLPARAEGYAWTLIFSTSQHGFSLNSMYRKMFKLESPILMVIEDTDNNVFGALTSCALSVSDHFYGTGESLLFSFTPDFKVFNWTGENLYFIKGNNESISIGAGDGKFGLWLDGDLYIGRSESCQTYGNDPLTPKIDFVVKTLECWAFISS